MPTPIRTAAHPRRRALAVAAATLVGTLGLGLGVVGGRAAAEAAPTNDGAGGVGAAAPAAAPTGRIIVRLRADAARATAQTATPSAAAPAAGTPRAVREVDERAALAAAAERMDALRERSRVAFRKLRPVTPELQVVRLEGGADARTLDAALARLRADPAVEYAEPDRWMRPQQAAIVGFAPNDPGFANQWYLQAPRDTASGRSASATDAAGAWTVTTGAASVVVAVLDTGVRFDHPDLGRADAGGKLLAGYDFVSGDSGGTFRTANDGNGWDPDPSDPGDWVSQEDRNAGGQLASCTIEDSSWHGTRVAGIVAAGTNNGQGVAGVGFDTRILPVRVLGKCGGFTSDIIAGMRWAAGLPVSGAPANPNPARVLNLSLGGDGSCSSSYQAAVDEIVARNVLVIVSAGNDGSTADAPSNCRGVAAIGAARHVGNKVGFSNLGPNLALTAPGGNCVNVGFGQPCLFSIDTTTNLGETVPGANGYTDQVNANFGTSFSAPIVSGIAALLYARHPNLTPAQAIARLRAAARPFPVVTEIEPSTNAPVAQCRVPTGESDVQQVQCNCTPRTCGAGLADAARTVQAADRPVAAIGIAGGGSAGGGAATGAQPGTTVPLDAFASSAARGASLASYAWSVQPAGAGTLGPAGGATTTLALPASGAVAVRLAVTDSAGGSDTVLVPLTAVVPDVAGRTRAAAAATLLAADLELGTVTTQTSTTVPAGAVVAQFPAAGGTVPAGASITLVLSSGAPSQLSVPSVVGLTQAAATTALTSAGLTVGNVTNLDSGTVPAGNVISQLPTAGSNLPPGGAVSLVVSSGTGGSAGGGGGGGAGGGGGGGAFDALALLALLLAAGARGTRPARAKARRGTVAR